MPPTDPPSLRRTPRRTTGAARRGIVIVAALSAGAAALSPAEPVGSRPADALWCALLGAAFTLIASRSRRWPLIWAGGVAAVVGVGGTPATKIATVALAVLVGVMVVSTRRERLHAALLGAVAINVLLRGQSYGFVGLPTLVGAAALLPVVWSGYTMAHRRERRTALAVAAVLCVAFVTFGVLAGVAALEARDSLQAGADEATAGLDQVRAADTEGATVRFTTGAQAFDDASNRLDGWMTWGGRFMPLVGQHVDALRTVASSGAALSESAATTSSTADYRSLTAVNGTIDLAEVESLAGPVADSSEVINQSLADVADVRSHWLVPPVGDELARFEEKLSDAGEQASIAAQALAVTPDLLGADGPRRYFIAFASPSESRNGGGFVGAYGLLAANDGSLQLEQSGDLNALNPTASEPAFEFQPPPDWDERYGSYYVQYFLGNLSASPDWPTDTGVIGQLFPQTEGGASIDGAIYVDPTALAGFLSLTGPVAVPELGVTVDAGNVEQFLERDQYVLIDPLNPQRKEILGDVARATFDALTSRPLPGISTLTETLGPLVAAGHLRLSTFDADSEQLLDRVGLSGRWDTANGADYLSVRSANLLSNKIDSFLRREVDVRVVVDPDRGTERQTVTVTLHNDAPAEGLPPYVIGNRENLPPGTNNDLLTLYSPHALRSVRVDGQPVAFSSQTELAGPVYSVPVVIGPGGTATVEFELEGVVQGWPYRFQAIPQPLANPDQLTVQIDGAPGVDNSLKFSGPFADDIRLGLSSPRTARSAKLIEATHRD